MLAVPQLLVCMELPLPVAQVFVHQVLQHKVHKVQFSTNSNISNIITLGGTQDEFGCYFSFCLIASELITGEHQATTCSKYEKTLSELCLFKCFSSLY